MAIFDEALSAINNLVGGTGNVTTTNDDFRCAGSVCKPTSRRVLDIVIDAQKQLNRVAQVKGFTKISVDGDIGPATLTLASKVISSSNGAIVGMTTSAAALALNIGTVGRMSKAFADGLGVPATVAAAPLAQTPSFVNPSTGALVPVPSAGSGFLDRIFGPLSSTHKLILAGLGAGIAYKVFVKKKKRGGRR